MGPAQLKWFGKGYQQGLADIEAKLREGGEEAVREWLANNLVRTCPHGCGILRWSDDQWICPKCGDEWPDERIALVNYQERKGS